MTPLTGFDPDIKISAMGELLGREVVTMEGGQSEVHFDIGEVWLNMQGILHGGAFAAMLDTACGVAVRSRLDMDIYRGHATLELKTSYFKAGYPGKFIANGQVLRMGKRIAHTDAGLVNGQGEAVARASATFALLLNE